jgi:F-type H+-transporting ATPase subunit b
VEGLKELINPRFLLSQLVNFLILFVALYFLMWKRALKAFDERKRRISQGLEDAEKAQQKLAEAEQEYARRVEEAQRERERILAAAREETAAAREEILAAANSEARKIRATADESVEADRQQMLAGLRDQVAALSIAAANKIVGETLDDTRQRRLINEFFGGVAAGRVQVLDEEDMAWAEAETTPAVSVVSALPLTDDEKRTVTRQLQTQLGRAPQLQFDVDPAILGGLKIAIGDRVIDGSVAGKLASLQDRLG